MSRDRRKLVAMYVALVSGCALYLTLGNWLGVVDVRPDRSLLVVFVGVTTLLYAVMVVTYKAASKRTP